MTRAERLGLESGSIDARLSRNEEIGREGCTPEPFTDREVSHSIAISLKRMADLEERMLMLHERQAEAMEAMQTNRSREQ